MKKTFKLNQTFFFSPVTFVCRNWKYKFLLGKSEAQVKIFIKQSVTCLNILFTLTTNLKPLTTTANHVQWAVTEVLLKTQ